MWAAFQALSALTFVLPAQPMCRSVDSSDTPMPFLMPFLIALNATISDQVLYVQTTAGKGAKRENGQLIDMIGIGCDKPMPAYQAKSTDSFLAFCAHVD